MTPPLRLTANQSNPQPAVIVEWLVNSVQDVARSQPDLWHQRQGEETRAAYVRDVLLTRVPGNWHVDPEYRRQGPGEDTKRRNDGRIARPDIVIHRRGDTSSDGNLLIVECKNAEGDFLKWSSPDGIKVIDLQQKFGYTVGALVSFGPTPTECAPKVLWRSSDGCLAGEEEVHVS